MKSLALSKPLSSPSRADKFPPPLMRFLRSNVGSRSRGRSRSSPLFYLRTKKTVPNINETTQEPSSPKVTCIGQVRVCRSSKSNPKSTSKKRRRRRRCWWWLKKTLFCGKISSRFRTHKNPFTKCVLFFKSDYCKKVDATEDSFRVYSNPKSEKNENVGVGSQESEKGYLESCSSSCPPKNALILTRCRSAPYRSSSLGGRFWGSPFADNNDNKTEKIDEKSDEVQKPSCENVEEARISEENNKELENLKAIGGGAVHPLLLTRCKSGPARTGERLDPDAIFLRQTRLEVIQNSPEQNS